MYVSMTISQNPPTGVLRQDGTIVIDCQQHCYFAVGSQIDCNGGRQKHSRKKHGILDWLSFQH
jgi:hypothetical protein